MFIRKRYLPRRTFLKGAGFTLGLPLLDAMVPAATAWADTAARPVQRAGWVYFPHGAIQDNTGHGAAWDRWTPRTDGADFQFSPILASLAPFREHVTVLSRLGNRPSETGQRAATRVGTWLTATLPEPNPVATRVWDTNIAPSVDQIAARHLGSQTPLPSLQLAAVNPSTEVAGPFGSSYSGNLSFPTAHSFLRPQSNLTLAFRNVFGEGGSAQDRALLRREYTSMLDVMMAGVANLQRLLGPGDRAILDDYLDSVRELERKIAQLEEQDERLGDLDVGGPPADPTDYAQKFDAMFDLIVLALRADMTRVFTFLAENEGSNRTDVLGVPLNPPWFMLASGHGDEVELLNVLVAVQAALTERFSRFIRKLAETPDGDGTLLDHAMIVWGSNVSEAFRGASHPLPTVLLGGGAGTIRGNQHLRYPDRTPLANLWLTMLHRLGVPAESLGDSTGVLSEV